MFVDEDSRDHTWVPHYYDYLFFNDSDTNATTVTCIGGSATPRTFTLGPGEFMKVICPEHREIAFRYTGFVTHVTGNVWYGIILRDLWREGRSARAGKREVRRRPRFDGSRLPARHGNGLHDQFIASRYLLLIAEPVT